MTDFTTKLRATVARVTLIQPGACAHCHCDIVGGRRRKYCTTSCRKDAIADRARNHVDTAKEITYKKDYQKVYRTTSTGIRASLRSRKKGRLDGTQGYRSREVYLKASRRTYRKRRKEQLVYARERQRKLSTRSVVYCATCGVEVPYVGHGRPRKRCPIHHRGRGTRRDREE